ncbi:MAG: hypothetical protein HY435_00380 [Candidatus Liptonbacteria bacterium]|nr:hypothetical protein [Candidatus Liptonbacteria bacterium]
MPKKPRSPQYTIVMAGVVNRRGEGKPTLKVSRVFVLEDLRRRHTAEVMLHEAGIRWFGE